MTEDVRLAVVGLGLVGRRHVEAIAQARGAALVAAVELSDEGRAWAEARGIEVCERLDALWAHAPDGVVLATPTLLHAEQAMACVAQGCPVLVEKPIATSAVAAEGLVVEAEARGVPVLVGHHRRHNPLIAEAHRIVTSGQIGAVRAVQATCWFYKPDDYFEAAPWRTRPGAGPISVNLAHDVDLMRYLCGEVETVQAVASPSARGYANEDVAAAVLGFAGGAVGTISVSDAIVAPWSWEMTARENPVYPPVAESCYLIGGSHGALSLPDLRVWSYGTGPRDWWAPLSATTPPRGASDPLVDQIAHFAAVIRGAAAPLVSGREGLRTLRVIEAIQRAAATGGTVTLSEANKPV